MAACVTAKTIAQNIDTSSDAYVRNAVVMLKDGHGACTGVQVETEQHQLFVLTAAHCRKIVDEQGKVLAITEDGTEINLTFMAEDDKSDLMMLRGDSRIGHIPIAKSIRIHDHVHTLTHGAMAPTYRTDGEVLDEVKGGFAVGIVRTPEEIQACVSKPKYTIIPDELFGDVYCVLDVMSLRSTAASIPGSSGGPLLTEKGELMGIVSYGNPNMPTFNYYVRLVDIQAFIDSAI